MVMKGLVGGIVALALAIGFSTCATSAAAQANATAGHSSVKLVGCLERDTPLSSAGATTASEITAFALTSVDADSLTKAGLKPGDQAAFRLRSDDDFELLDHVGRRVEVTGRLLGQDGGAPAGPMVVTAEGVVAPLPILWVTSLHTIAHGCR